MLLACFVLETDGTEPTVTVRYLKKGTVETVFSGPLSQWTTVKKDVARYGRCIICFYGGAAVMSIDRTESKNLAADLTANAKMMTEVFPNERTVLYFVDRKSLSEIRRSFADAGASIIAEHLVPDSYLLSDEIMKDYYGRICKRELSLRFGTIDESRMMTYRLARLKRMLLPVLATVFVLALTSSLIDMDTSEKINRLSSMMQSYSSTLEKNRSQAADMDKVLASRADQASCGSAAIISSVTSGKPEGVFFRSVLVTGRNLVIDAMAVSSRDISAISSILSENELLETVQVSEVKRSTAEGYLDFRITGNIK